MRSRYTLEFRRYARQLRTPLKMSRGEISLREGVIVKLVDSVGRVSYAEVLTLPYYGTETVVQSLDVLSRLNNQVTIACVDSISESYPATRFALEAAILKFDDQRLSSSLNSEVSRPVSFLLPAGDLSYPAVLDASRRGFTTFKWKIGIGEPRTEMQQFERLLSVLPDGSSLRLDANGGLTEKVALEWLLRCEGSQVEFIEQPLLSDRLTEMQRLAERSTTPIALDESVASFDDLLRCATAGWEGIFVVKPSRLRRLRSFLEWRENTSTPLVYSSALETSIGTELGLCLAASDTGNSMALGYGVAQWFEPDSLYCHPDLPTLRPGLCTSEDNERIWQSLSVAGG